MTNYEKLINLSPFDMAMFLSDFALEAIHNYNDKRVFPYSYFEMHAKLLEEAKGGD